MKTLPARRSDAGVTMRHPRLFWLGVVLVTAGVALHIPMFASASDMHYVMRGMPWDLSMIAGMGCIVFGLVAMFRGMWPRPHPPAEIPHEGYAVEVAETATLSRAHIRLALALVFAIAIDSQKPFTFTFILPAVAKEYGLSSPAHHAPGHWPVALLPLAGISGTVLGSLIWGYWGDRVGRRAPILGASGLFIATAACGAMPEFTANIIMCLLMGVGAGGLLPVAYSLMTEALPARWRGQGIVLVAGLGTALGFLLTSWLAAWLMPTFGWRIMWFVGAPTGVALIALSPFVPESPRFLLARGKQEEARAVMHDFGMSLRPQPAAGVAGEYSAIPVRNLLLAPRLRPVTVALGAYGLAWGLVNYGFLVWLPTHLASTETTTSGVTAMIAKAALFSVPGAFVVSWLYARWSSKWTVISSALGLALALAAFASFGPAITRHTSILTALVVVLLVTMWAAVSALLPYAAELYPTTLRSIGGGAIAGATKLGGVLAFGMAVASVSPPGIAGAAMLAGVPMIIAALALVVVGRETSGRQLDQITLDAIPAAPLPSEQ